MQTDAIIIDTVIEEYIYDDDYINNGTCHGAYWSGVRAAREVAEVIK